MQINPELQLAWDVIEKTGTHLFLTGKAGTGKTTFLKRLKESSPKRMVVTAPTGIAAINAGGVTLHSFFQLPFAPYVPDSTFNAVQTHYKFGKEKINIIRSMDLLVIDEISMVRADLLDAVDAALRRYRNRYKPFGGVQLLMIGDMQQLAPVLKDNERNLLSQYYDTAFFFDSRILKSTKYVTIELKKVYRQSDTRFLNLLNKIRNNEADEMTLGELNKRCIPDFQPKEEEGYIRLNTHNYHAQQYNDQKLNALDGQAYSFRAQVKDNFPETSYPADELLTLKKGAQIMFIKNDSSADKRFYNGKVGLVTAVSKDSIRVRGNGDDQDFQLSPEEWTNSKYTLNPETKEITEAVEGTFRQYPIRLAWAITIHKSQGLTFERAIIDANSSFAHGQVYVALSRCKTLEGMVLASPLTGSSIICDSIIKEFDHQIEEREPDARQLQNLQRDYFFELLSEQFGFRTLEQRLSQIVRLFDEHLYRLYPQLLERYKETSAAFQTKISKVADTFKMQYSGLITTTEDYANDSNLNRRIVAGAGYFRQELETLFSALLDETKVETNNKELKKKFAENLILLKEAVYIKQGTLALTEKEGFSVSAYLKHKAALLLSKEDKSEKRDRKNRTVQSEKKAQRPDTKEVSYGLYKQGMRVEEIARERGYVPGTIISHLERYIRAGDIPVEELVAQEKIDRINQYLDKHGSENGLAVVKAALGDEISYEDIKVTMLSRRGRGE